MTIEGMGATSLVYHNQCKEMREKKKEMREKKQETKKDETLILLMEEENGIEAV